MRTACCRKSSKATAGAARRRSRAHSSCRLAGHSCTLPIRNATSLGYLRELSRVSLSRSSSSPRCRSYCSRDWCSERLCWGAISTSTTSSSGIAAAISSRYLVIRSGRSLVFTSFGIKSLDEYRGRSVDGPDAGPPSPVPRFGLRAPLPTSFGSRAGAERECVGCMLCGGGGGGGGAARCGGAANVGAERCGAVVAADRRWTA